MAFVALVPLAMACRHARPGRAAAAGMAFGVAFFGLLFPWIHLFGTAAYILLVVLEAAFVAAALAAGSLVERRLPGRLGCLAFPLAFLVGEYTRSHVPLGGFPWGGLGYSQHNFLPVLRLAAYTGVWGISLLVAVANALVAEAIVTLAARPGALRGTLTAATLLGLGALAVGGATLLPVPTPAGAPVRVALVQGNPPPANPSAPAATARLAAQIQAQETTALAGKQVDLVVWPESSLQQSPFTHPALMAPLQAAIQAVDAPFLVGADIGMAPEKGVDDGVGRFRNESLLFGPSGSLQAAYVKIHLVPFGEYVPARHLLASWIHELGKVPIDGIPGSQASVFTIEQGTFATPICYETAYPELVGDFVANGARLLIVSTDNSSFLRTPASEQMVDISQLRAAEQRMWVAQAAITGISAVIAPSGRVTERTGLFEPAVLAPTLRFATTETFYGRHGDWLPIAAITACGVLFVAGLVPRRSHHPAPPASTGQPWAPPAGGEIQSWAPPAGIGRS